MLNIFCVATMIAGASPAIDSLAIPTIATAPVVDGRADDREYGAPALHLTTAAGDVRIWMSRSNGFIHIAAAIPDTSFYWGDDFVISLDADGSADASPQTGDRQWYLRRTLDSSVVFAAQGGRWETPGSAAPMLGATRRGEDWDVASTSSASGWMVELRVRESSVKAGAKPPRIAFRTYNDGPRGWWSWPAPSQGAPAQRVERSPELWVPITWR
jgi:hypothetical protein